MRVGGRLVVVVGAVLGASAVAACSSSVIERPVQAVVGQDGTVCIGIDANWLVASHPPGTVMTPPVDALALVSGTVRYEVDGDTATGTFTPDGGAPVPVSGTRIDTRAAVVCAIR